MEKTVDKRVTNLITRALSGIVLVAVIIGAIYLSYLSFGALLAAIVLGGLYEFYRMTRAKGFEPQVVMGMVAGLAVFTFGFDYFYNGSANNVYIALFLMMLLPMMFLMELCRCSKDPFSGLGTTLLGVIYISVPMAMLLGVPLLIGDGVWNPLIMIFYFAITWSGDSFAYLVGVPFGRHKLNEKISPLKSWEGLIGGVVGAVLMGVVASCYAPGDRGMWIVIALIVSLVGTLGDLVESMFKRTCGVKDSGTMMPGHGGWMDRFDSLIFSAPFVLLYLIACKL